MISPEILRKFTFFSDLPREVLVALAKIARQEKYAAGAVIFHEGDSADHFYLVLDGEVHLLIEIDERKTMAVIDVLSWGDTMGWSVVVEPHLFTSTATCAAPTTVIAIDGPAFRALLNSDSEVGFKFMQRLIQVVAARLKDTRLRLTSLMPTEEPLAQA
jgi:CRP-like cAMP-binding protein